MNVADLYEEHREKLTRYAISLSRQLDRADDLVQETFVRALRHSGDLQRMNPYQQEAWLKRVLRNRFYDEERATRNRHSYEGVRSRLLGIQLCECLASTTKCHGATRPSSSFCLTGSIQISSLH